MNNQLTGKFYFKERWYGLVLMVEYVKTSLTIDDTYHWRKAKFHDLWHLNLTSNKR